MSTTKPLSAPCFYAGQDYVMAESMGHLLFQLMLSMRREIETRMGEHDLTDAQWKPLWLLKNGHSHTALELAREMCVDAGAMTRMLDRLEAKGLVQRLRSETDRRVVNVLLTAQGESVVEHIPHVLASVNNDFLRGFSKQEWTQFKELCQKMLANGQALHTKEENPA